MNLLVDFTSYYITKALENSFRSKASDKIEARGKQSEIISSVQRDRYFLLYKDFLIT